ncbi:MAG: alpha/beta hydrolase [Urechidicola sp.]|nr:alpha/beta hydrolase [Urechidicola sp.]
MVKKILLILIIFYVFILIGFYFFQNSIVFRPKKTAKNHTYSFQQDFKEINLKAKDKATLNALHFKVDKPQGVILYFHGNKDNLERWGAIAAKLTKYNYDVFVVDYRGYGKSTGTRTEELMYADAQLCYNHLKQSYKENSIVVYGRSLGGTFATFVASQNNPKQLILEATFSSLEDVVFRKLPILPYSKILKFKFKTFETIGKVKCPITIFHGNQDELVSINLAKKVYAQANKEMAEFVTIENGTHHNLTSFEKYHVVINSVLR